MAAKQKQAAAAAPVETDAEPIASPALMSVKQRRNLEQSALSILIWGTSASGKTTQAIREAQGNTLVLGWAGLDEYYENAAAEDFSVLGPFGDWNQFEADVLTPFRLAGGLEGKKYDTIIVDGLESALRVLVTTIGGDSPTQQHWGIVSKRLGSMLTLLRSNCSKLIATVRLVEKTNKDGEGLGEYKVALNPDSYQNVRGKFAKHWYTFVTPHEYDDNGDVASLVYGIETNATLATNMLVSSSARREIVHFGSQE